MNIKLDIFGLIHNCFKSRIRCALYIPHKALLRPPGEARRIYLRYRLINRPISPFPRLSGPFGWVVLASDASHFYANMDLASPFPIVFDVAQMLEGYDVLRRWADSDEHIVPGHDPLVLRYYPAAREDLRGAVARVDLPPDMS